jgi:hypothetical protein
MPQAKKKIYKKIFKENLPKIVKTASFIDF